MHTERKAAFVLILIVGIVALPALANASEPYVWTKSKFNYHPANGCVPDAKTAFRIANAVLTAVYGEKEVTWNKPFTAVLRKGVWTIGGMGNHPGINGGGMEIDIAKLDGRITRIYAGM
jgi:hypothetical protein